MLSFPVFSFKSPDDFFLCGCLEKYFQPTCPSGMRLCGLVTWRSGVCRRGGRQEMAFLRLWEESPYRSALLASLTPSLFSCQLQANFIHFASLGLDSCCCFCLKGFSLELVHGGLLSVLISQPEVTSLQEHLPWLWQLILYVSWAGPQCPDMCSDIILDVCWGCILWIRFAFKLVDFEEIALCHVGGPHLISRSFTTTKTTHSRARGDVVSQQPWDLNCNNSSSYWPILQILDLPTLIIVWSQFLKIRELSHTHTDTRKHADAHFSGEHWPVHWSSCLKSCFFFPHQFLCSIIALFLFHKTCCYHFQLSCLFICFLIYCLFPPKECTAYLSCGWF